MAAQSFDSNLKETQPRLTQSEVGELAADLFGVEGSWSDLPSERDQNLLVRAADGQRWVFKISNTEETLAFLQFQLAMLDQIQSAGDCPSTPVVRESLNGNRIERLPSGHFVRLVRYLEGTPLARVRPHQTELLRDIGRGMARIDASLQPFQHPAANRVFKWDLGRAEQVIQDVLHLVQPSDDRRLIESVLKDLQGKVADQWSSLRRSVIHNDANDYNLLVDDRVEGQRLSGVIDFGDALETATVAELAIGCAYVMMGKRDPIRAACVLVEGYHETFPVHPHEVELLLVLIRTRLATSLAISHEQTAQQPDNEYLRISVQGVRELLMQLDTMPASLATAEFRNACGWEPCRSRASLVNWLAENPAAPIVKPENDRWALIDFSIDSPLMTTIERLNDVAEATKFVFGQLQEQHVAMGVGRYGEPRLVYQSDQFLNRAGAPRTIHLGIDLFLPAGSPLYCPYEARVHSFQNNDLPLDYGPTIILEHRTNDLIFYTLYGHLSMDSIESLRSGQTIAAGESFARIGDADVNGGWVPHLHFQVIADLLEMRGDFPGVGPADGRAVWESLNPDPNLILRIDGLKPYARLTELHQQRRSRTTPALSLAYREPLEIVKGKGQFLYDTCGLEYLDCVNNVAHVGHGHPEVTRAIAEQSSVLNTNTRYLNPRWSEYVERLLAKFPSELDTCVMTCSGSEANELALRMAKAHTGAEDVLVLDHGYHGNTSTLVEVSPYKFNGPGGRGPGRGTHVLDLPDRHQTDFDRVIAQIEAAGSEHAVAALLAESISGCGGQVVLPDGFLRAIYTAARGQGAVCIADEVQTGFGRVGSHFWAFETQGVIPDIVTLGKPIGNGHPMGAVITRGEIAESFAGGMEYFNTFGGNPVSCAAGIAVLDAIETEQLQEHAQSVGPRLLEALINLQAKHAVITDVRGRGLFLGVELGGTSNGESSDELAHERIRRLARYVIEQMKQRRILLSLDGPLGNVIKIKPPMIFSLADAQRLCRELDEVLAHTAVRSFDTSRK